MNVDGAPVMLGTRKLKVGAAIPFARGAGGSKCEKVIKTRRTEQHHFHMSHHINAT